MKLPKLYIFDQCIPKIIHLMNVIRNLGLDELNYTMDYDHAELQLKIQYDRKIVWIDIDKVQFVETDEGTHCETTTLVEFHLYNTGPGIEYTVNFIADNQIDMAVRGGKLIPLRSEYFHDTIKMDFLCSDEEYFQQSLLNDLPPKEFFHGCARLRSYIQNTLHEDGNDFDFLMEHTLWRSDDEFDWGAIQKLMQFTIEDLTTHAVQFNTGHFNTKHYMRHADYWGRIR